MDDGMEAGMLRSEMLRRHVRIFHESLVVVEREFPAAPQNLLANEALKKMLNTLVGDLIRETARRVKAEGIVTLEDVRRSPQRLVAFSPQMEELRREAKQHLYAALYSSEELQRDLQDAALVVRNLFTFWVNDPSRLPAANQSQIPEHGVPRVVADYIAAMTDNYILLQYADWVKDRGSVPG
jgi:dGTPase